MKTEEEIKMRLFSLLSAEEVDYGEILSLSNELSKYDKDNVRFSVDAGVIDRLGSELVARQETAVSELIKNAYDADATHVKLIFENTASVGGRLYISDNGSGMSRDELINGFMRIASTSKIHNKYSSKFRRSRAGQKGIGRFAVQRLGQKLIIRTQSDESDIALELSIDWKDYQNDTDLFSISNSIKEIPQLPNSGTTLIIDDLSDKWSKASIKRIYRYISEIIQPFSLSDDINYSNNNFTVTLSKMENAISEDIVDSRLNVYDYATAIIDGKISDDGIGHFDIYSEKLDINESGFIGNDPNNDNVPFNKLNNVKFRAYYFIYKSNLIPKMHETAIQKLASQFGGIKLYRNSFRVLPYGEAGDDWLKLDASTRRRTLLPVHANINFFGFVEITDNNNQFQETSSREGLIENDAFIQLQNFVYRSILTSVVRIAELRNIKIISNQKKYDKTHYEKIEITINNIATTIEELDKILDTETGSITTKRRSKQKFEAAKAEFLKLRKLQKEEQEIAFKEKSMLRVLGSIGLTIGQFIHEIKYYLDNIKSDIRYLSNQLINNEQLYQRLQLLEKNFSEFHTYTSYFNNVMSNNVIRELEPIEIRTVVDDFIESIKPDCEKSNIHINKPIYNGVLLYTKPMHTSEWSSILFNLFTNSKKAIYKTGNMGLLGVECGVSENMIYLEFSDNGIGISKDIEDRIFDEFFTTTSGLNYDEIDSNNAILGTGLGLKIVKDIIDSYKGNICVVAPKGDFNTCIRIEVPMLNNKDFEKYGL
jgi:signal transduction histidine kinase